MGFKDIKFHIPMCHEGHKGIYASLYISLHFAAFLSIPLHFSAFYILRQFDGADAIFILVPLPQGRECKGKHSIPVCRVRGLPEREF